MEDVISPPPAKGGGRNELPAYVSNGLVGLRVRDNPLIPGMALLSGFSGRHPVRRIEPAALIPYPLAGDICIDGVRLSEAPQNVRIIDQAYDFATGELTSRLAFNVEDRQAEVEILTFCSRDQPTIVCQEIGIEVDGACDASVTAKVDLSGIPMWPFTQARSRHPG